MTPFNHEAAGVEEMRSRIEENEKPMPGWKVALCFVIVAACMCGAGYGIVELLTLHP